MLSVLIVLSSLLVASCQNAASLAAWRSAVDEYILGVESDPLFEEEILQITNIQLAETLAAITSITPDPKYLTGYPAFFSLLPESLSPAFVSIYSYEYEQAVSYGLISNGVILASSSAAATEPTTFSTAISSPGASAAFPTETSISYDGYTASAFLPSTTSTSASGQSPGLSQGAKIGIGVGAGVGGAIVLALLAWLIVFLVKKHRRGRREQFGAYEKDPSGVYTLNQPHAT